MTLPNNANNADSKQPQNAGNTAQDGTNEESTAEQATADDNANTEGNTAQGPTQEGADTPDDKQRYEEVLKRNDELTQQLSTLLDSVAKLIDSGLRLGNPAPAEPAKRTPSKQDQQLDALMGGK